MTAQSVLSESVTERISRTGRATCEPRLKYFCENIHIGCSGRSAIPTAAFTVVVNGDNALLERLVDSATPVSTGPPGAISWPEGGAYAIVRFPGAPGYLKISSDGTYSMRRYSSGTAYMAYGSCR